MRMMKHLVLLLTFAAVIAGAYRSAAARSQTQDAVVRTAARPPKMAAKGQRWPGTINQKTVVPVKDQIATRVPVTAPRR
jgi:hypothetical protein